MGLLPPPERRGPGRRLPARRTSPARADRSPAGPGLLARRHPRPPRPAGPTATSSATCSACRPTSWSTSTNPAPPPPSTSSPASSPSWSPTASTTSSPSASIEALRTRPLLRPQPLAPAAHRRRPRRRLHPDRRLALLTAVHDAADLVADAADALLAGRPPAPTPTNSSPSPPVAAGCSLTAPDASPSTPSAAARLDHDAPSRTPAPARPMTAANQAQHDAWNGESGHRWVADADRRDRSSPPSPTRCSPPPTSTGRGRPRRRLRLRRHHPRGRRRRRRRGTVTGIDLSKPMLNLARQRAQDDSVDVHPGRRPDPPLRPERLRRHHQPLRDHVLRRPRRGVRQHRRGASDRRAGCASPPGSPSPPTTGSSSPAPPSCATGRSPTPAARRPGMFAQSDPDAVTDVLTPPDGATSSSIWSP